MAAGALCLLASAATSVATVGCAQKGTVAFRIDAPDRKELSPFLDGRRDTVLVTDEAGNALGFSVNTSAPPGAGLDIGDIVVGHYPLLQLAVTGGGQLLGLARTRNVDVVAERATSVAFHVRKPLAFYGASGKFGSPNPQLPPPGPLMGLDTTLPASPVLNAVPLQAQMLATGATHDGLLLFAASPGKLVALDTGSLYALPPIAVAIQRVPGAPGAPVPRTIAIAPDDSLAVVVTDQGIAWIAPAVLQTMLPQGLEITKITNARRAAFSPSGKKVGVLVGPSWEEIDCTQAQQPATRYWEFTVSDDHTKLMSPTDVPAPPGATDVGFDASNDLPLFAVPCGGLRAGIVNAAGVPVLQGEGIFDIVRVGDRLLGVTGSLTTVKAADPDDSGLRGKLASATPSGMSGRAFAYPQFVIPSDSITVEVTEMGNVFTQVKLKPTTIVAYRADATPDGSNLVFLHRMRYQASKFEFFVLVERITNRKVFYCTLDALRDVYRLTVADASTGAIGYQSTKGVNDVSKCAITCYDCFFGNCNMGQPDTSCTVNDGFVPDGLSVMMGGD